MTKKRLGLDFDMERYDDRLIWEHMEAIGCIKSKWIRKILVEYITGSLELKKPNISYEVQEIEKEIVCDISDDELENIDGLDGFI